MMFILSLILFLGGIALFAVAFMVESLQAVIFTVGILAICLAMALPMFKTAK
ncbi:hypothetical protein [Microbacterium amylolyticum]|uniref:DUF1328 domain-containing protein n=1 Tax=Microbacterium amylolyticum TaxID=936337 RepID=A0ABS4ZJF7_9MICO|nr:hypothetical protein [Microbacterium amylolyticum]MBP2437428.1 hypothetical protein [Microbacterium amylolyticum]